MFDAGRKTVEQSYGHFTNDCDTTCYHVVNICCIADSESHIMFNCDTTLIPCNIQLEGLAHFFCVWLFIAFYGERARPIEVGTVRSLRFAGVQESTSGWTEVPAPGRGHDQADVPPAAGPLRRDLPLSAELGPPSPGCKDPRDEVFTGAPSVSRSSRRALLVFECTIQAVKQGFQGFKIVSVDF